MNRTYETKESARSGRPVELKGRTLELFFFLARKKYASGRVFIFQGRRDGWREGDWGPGVWLAGLSAGLTEDKDGDDLLVWSVTRVHPLFCARVTQETGHKTRKDSMH